MNNSLYANYICDIELERCWFCRRGRWKAFSSPILSLWNFWIKAPVCSKGAQVTVLSHSRSGSLLCRRPEFHAPMLQYICLPFYTKRLASRFMTDDEVQYWLNRVLPSVCVQKLEHSERVVMKFYVRKLNWSFSKYKLWFRSDKSHRYSTRRAFEHTLQAEVWISTYLSIREPCRTKTVGANSSTDLMCVLSSTQL